MKISLPDDFRFMDTSRRGKAYVKDGILYVIGYVKFEELMYMVTYALKGNDKCYYCGAELTKKNRTLDHLYPRSLGGVSITDNLVPSCKLCNQNKKDMTYHQFKRYRELKSLEKQREFYSACERENLRVRRKKRFVINSEWLSVYDIREVLKHMKFNNLEKSKSRALAEYYSKWGQYTHPVIVSSNGWIFKGRHILHHAKGIKRHGVIAIVLDNVVVINKDTL